MPIPVSRIALTPAFCLTPRLALLNRANGTVAWKCFLVKKGEINRFHSESDEEFLVSSGDERFWLVDHPGKQLMRCTDQCLQK